MIAVNSVVIIVRVQKIDGSECHAQLCMPAK